MSMKKRVRNLESRSSEPKVHYTWVDPGLTDEQLEAHVQEVRREQGLSADAQVFAFHWKE